MSRPVELKCSITVSDRLRGGDYVRRLCAAARRGWTDARPAVLRLLDPVARSHAAGHTGVHALITDHLDQFCDLANLAASRILAGSLHTESYGASVPGFSSQPRPPFSTGNKWMSTTPVRSAVIVDHLCSHLGYAIDVRNLCRESLHMPRIPNLPS